jgi:hypothetical protein
VGRPRGLDVGQPPAVAVDRVIAAWLAVTFSALTTLAMVTVTLTRASTTGALAGGAVGVTLTAVASTMLARARAYRRTLLARRDELERPEH